ncbi:MAG: phage holin family protein, partial [Candidatus Gracilibacteria bacterium]|nr:phage holin family protein [Candidatus Gracilibacteria bacterium]
FQDVLEVGVKVTGGLKLYFIGGVILGLLNYTIKPILKILGLPFIIITFGLFILVINGVILFLLEKIIAGLSIPGVTFSIHGILNFIIAVAIFTIFNTIYNTFFKK